jgi:superfamily II DNA/RNA helicase
MTFESLGLPEPLVRAVADAGYAEPTAVQTAAIPPALAGTDLEVQAVDREDVAFAVEAILAEHRAMQE